MRGRLGSMGSISSFERVSVLEGEDENSQNFTTRGTLGILTSYPAAFKSMSCCSSALSAMLLLSSVSGVLEANVSTALSLLTWRHDSALCYSRIVS